MINGKLDRATLVLGQREHGGLGNTHCRGKVEQRVGPARIGGVETDQYAYSSGDVDWQVWIERGDKPLPRKIVITSLFDETDPQFSAIMSWNTAPGLKDADFTFTPPPNATSIKFATAATTATTATK